MITITEEGAAAICARMKEKPDAAGLRLTVKETGCSGNSYKMEYVSEVSPTDDRFEQDGAVLFIPKTASWMLAGMTIGFEEKPMGQSGFTFSNPNEVSRCGCGESFQVDSKLKNSPS